MKSKNFIALVYLVVNVPSSVVVARHVGIAQRCPASTRTARFTSAGIVSRLIDSPDLTPAVTGVIVVSAANENYVRVYGWC